MTGTDVLVEREVRIAARPETVYGFLTVPEKVVAWMGREATLEVRPGGLFRVDYNGSDVVRGEFLEVVENERVVVTWGWEADGAETPPGASVVEFTLTPDGDGTVLRVVHRGLSADEARSHGEGWDFFLPRLVAAAG
jgi:uncharacterized protein YndB with AHSA1/START domain